MGAVGGEAINLDDREPPAMGRPPGPPPFGGTAADPQVCPRRCESSQCGPVRGGNLPCPRAGLRRLRRDVSRLGRPMFAGRCGWPPVIPMRLRGAPWSWTCGHRHHQDRAGSVLCALPVGAQV